MSSPSKHVQKPFHQMQLSEVEKEAQEGNKYAQIFMGRIYENGRSGVAKNQEKAIFYYTKASEHGVQEALVNLANIYMTLGANPKDCVEFLVRATKTKERQDSQTAKAYFNLGNIYAGISRLKGIQYDHKKALEYLEAASALDHVHATGLCAQFHIKGWGTEENYEKFKEYAMKAAALGDGKSALLLANVIVRRVEKSSYPLVKKYLKLCKKCTNVSRAEKNIADDLMKRMAKDLGVDQEKSMECCKTCGKSECALQLCSGCRLVKYCSRQCQVKDWKRHKKACVKSSKKKVKKSKVWSRLFNGLQIPSGPNGNRLLVPFIQHGLPTLKNNSVFLFSGFTIPKVSLKDVRWLKDTFTNTTTFNVKYHEAEKCTVCPHCESLCQSNGVLVGEIMFRFFNQYFKGQEVFSQRAFPRLFHVQCVREMRVDYSGSGLVKGKSLLVAWEEFLPEISQFQKSKRIHSLENTLKEMNGLALKMEEKKMDKKEEKKKEEKKGVRVDEEIDFSEVIKGSSDQVGFTKGQASLL